MKEKFDRNKKYGDIKDIGLDSNAPIEERIKVIENTLKLYYGIICDSEVKKALISSLEKTLTGFKKEYVADRLKEKMIFEKNFAAKDGISYSAGSYLCDLSLNDTSEILSSLGYNYRSYDFRYENLMDGFSFPSFNKFYVDLINEYSGNIEEAQKGIIVIYNIDDLFPSFNNMFNSRNLFIIGLICTLLENSIQKISYKGKYIDFDTSRISVICLGNSSNYKNLPRELLDRLVIINNGNVKDSIYGI